MSCSHCEEIISTSNIINHCLQEWRNTIVPGERSQHYRPNTIIPLSKERLDMAAYTFSITWKMIVLSKKTHFRGIKMFVNSCSNLSLKNILPITKHLASKKDVSVNFFSYLYRQHLRTFMRIKVTTMKKKFYGIH